MNHRSQNITTKKASKKNVAVAEIQGLYGPFTLSERVLQKVWLRRDFATGTMRTLSGKTLEVDHPGRWNHHEGPDFIAARLRIDGAVVEGDVEVHFQARDWLAHGHGKDAQFGRVVLHVVLFASETTQAVQTSTGRMPETFVLGHYMREDLESFASEDALLEMEALDGLEWANRFLALDEAARLELLEAGARQRWEQKCRFAALRLERDSWEAACHKAALEVLGYRRNRAPMAQLAERYPLKRWQAGTLLPEQLFREEGERWKLQGLRPANHPLKRLRQYEAWVVAVPDWPQHLRDLFQISTVRYGDRVETESLFLGQTKAMRRALEMTKLRQALSEKVSGGTLGGSRMPTMVVDAFLPLFAASASSSASATQLTGALWAHWYPGDTPEQLKVFLREAILKSVPGTTHSNGLNQGALQLFFSEGAIFDQ